MSADLNRSRLELVRNLRAPRNNNFDIIAGKLQECLDYINEQKKVLAQRKARIASLEAELADLKTWHADLSVSNERLKRDYNVLYDWGDGMVVTVKRYQDLYGPLPAQPKNSGQ